MQGYASLGNGTTGGADLGSGIYEQTVSTGAELRDALQAEEFADRPLTIYVDGEITWENSNKDGIDIRRNNVSILGRANAAFIGVGLEIRHGASNIIIRNLTMSQVPQSHGAGDIISLDGRDGPIRNIWIDHNELFNSLTPAIPDDCTSDCNNKDYHDELVSGRGDVGHITISYNYLHDSWKTSLWGSSDSAEEDTERTVTFSHNYWENVNSRLPLFRYGEGHVFNNYYHQVAGSGINARMRAEMRIDGNVFESVKDPIVSMDSPELGYWNVEHNLFSDITGGGSCNASTPPCRSAHGISTGSFMPPYDYALMDPQFVKVHLNANVGAGQISHCFD